MSSINNIMDIARKGLFASQAAIEVTGQNITNVNTVGYSRRYVRLEESLQIDYRPGQIGMGVEAAEILRHFDRFVETSYLDKATMRERFDTLFGNLSAVDNLFNETVTGGVSDALSKFFGDWQTVAGRPDDDAARISLLSDTRNLLNVIHQADEQMRRMQEQADQFIQKDVDSVNRILKEIAGINSQLKMVEVPGQNNANALRDQRDVLVRELAGIIDINVITRGNEQDFTITTKAGHTLLQNEQTYSLKFEGPRVTSSLTAASTFGVDGKMYTDGVDDFEYTIEITQAGDLNDDDPSIPATLANNPKFRVSLDGGHTWLTDENGNQIEYTAGTQANVVEVRGVKIWFGQQGDSATAPTNDPAVGDRFLVVPKSAVYWYQDTSTSENISPQILGNGEDNSRRLTGGSLAGHLNFRDNNIGRYRDKLDAFARELVWSVNEIHSEGAGLQKLSEVTGTYQVLNSGAALSSDTASLFFRDKLQSGSLSFYVFDAAGNLQNGGQPLVLDFDNVTAGQQNFDPAVHSLNDVSAAFNNTLAAAGLGGDVQASVVNGSLRISTTGGHTFGFGQDSTGLLAALGVNTYFTGTGASSIELNSAVAANKALVNVGHYNGAGEINEGDNIIARDIAALQTKKLTIHTDLEGNARQTLSEFYNSLVTGVGADTRGAEFNFEYQRALAQDLNEKQQSMSGVNLDEEMSNLIKFQHSYTAAAKLITTADQMLQTLLSLKP